MTRADLINASMPLLQLSGIDKRFPGVHALKTVSFDVRAGEIHALVGENGAGKSTLMRVLSGLHQPDAWQMEIDGRPVVLRAPADGFALGLAMGAPGHPADREWTEHGGHAARLLFVTFRRPSRTAALVTATR